MSENILNALNKEQQLAVKQVEGPVLVLAGAGSGKTRVLTHRIAYLISKGVNPLNILGVTFTNKAASEMKERVKKLLVSSGNSVMHNNRLLMPALGTFHSICVRILRAEIGLLGLKSSFNIFDSDDQLKAVKTVMKEMNIDIKQINPRAILSMISSAKNELMEPEEYEKNVNGHVEKMAAVVYKKYKEFLQKNQGLDFDDLIMVTVKLFEKNPETLKKYQDRFKYILVDEYQDTNHAQYTLLNLLASDNDNLFVVGDDWQSIYGWRGANIQNILDFEKDYKNVETFKMERNYRSTQNILDAAHEIITKNYKQKDKKLWTDNNKGTKPVVYEARDQYDEGNFIIQEIHDVIEDDSNDYSYKNAVVLYRTNVQSRALEEAFLQQNIPYKIVGGVRFYERREVKDVMAHLKFIHNNQDSISLERIINFPARGIGAVSFNRIKDIANEHEGDLFKAMGQYLQEKHSDKLRNFYDVMMKAVEKSKKEKIADALDFILDKVGYKDFVLDGTEEGDMRWDNIQELKSVTNNYDHVKPEVRLQAFLEEISLIADIDQVNDLDDAVTLMTVHSAKGLEFEMVFIAGMEENIFPHSHSMQEASEMEEERRLCYVAMTRAKESLYMIYTQAREIYGSVQANAPSRFIEDIPEDLLDVQTTNDLNFSDGESASNFGKFEEGVDEEPDYDVDELQKGDRIVHPKFGPGIICGIDDSMIEITFANAGTKKLAKDYAPVQKISR